MVQKYFMGSIFTLVVGLMLAFFIGGLPALWITLVLGILEVSLSFDNAIVNAKVLANMEDVWRKRFITWGMLIAVFGMRLIFPLLIVSITMWIDPVSSLLLAINEPEQYQHILESVHTSVLAFGFSFLLMVSLNFFIDSEKEDHWLYNIEKYLVKFDVFDSLTILKKFEINLIHSTIILVLTCVMYFIINQLHGYDEAITFVLSSFFGLLLYILVDSIGNFLEVDTTAITVKTGIGSFLYLEVLDASFSFDGTISSFALTNNIFLIAIGLGIGAMAVRSLTLLMVDKGTIQAYKFLEHGAFYAIFCLSIMMMISTVYMLPEAITGLVGAILIGLSILCSMKESN